MSRYHYGQKLGNHRRGRFVPVVRENRYADTCKGCGAQVRAREGFIYRDRTTRGWECQCRACMARRGHAVETVFSTGPGDETTVRRNVVGRCEDAPCCGCCSA